MVNRFSDLRSAYDSRFCVLHGGMDSGTSELRLPHRICGTGFQSQRVRRGRQVADEFQAGRRSPNTGGITTYPTCLTLDVRIFLRLRVRDRNHRIFLAKPSKPCK